MMQTFMVLFYIYKNFKEGTILRGCLENGILNGKIDIEGNVICCNFILFQYFQDNLSMLAEVGCYSGALLSLLIAWRLFKIESLTFIIKMYLFYFTIDSIFGVLEAIFLFKLKRDR